MTVHIRARSFRLHKGEVEWLRRLRHWLWRIRGREAVASACECPDYRVLGPVRPEVFGVADCALARIIHERRREL